MTDFLHPMMDEHALRQCSALALAHMGDSVYELMTRGWLIASGLVTSRNLHRETIRLVCAGAQAAGAHVIQPMLTEEEQAVFKRGRNANVHAIPQHASRAQYQKATALEALLGWLYLNGRRERINELFKIMMEE